MTSKLCHHTPPFQAGTCATCHNQTAAGTDAFAGAFAVARSDEARCTKGGCTRPAERPTRGRSAHRSVRATRGAACASREGAVKDALGAECDRVHAVRPRAPLVPPDGRAGAGGGCCVRAAGLGEGRDHCHGSYGNDFRPIAPPRPLRVPPRAPTCPAPREPPRPALSRARAGGRGVRDRCGPVQGRSGEFRIDLPHPWRRANAPLPTPGSGWWTTSRIRRRSRPTKPLRDEVTGRRLRPPWSAWRVQ